MYPRPFLKWETRIAAAEFLDTKHLGKFINNLARDFKVQTDTVVNQPTEGWYKRARKTEARTRWRNQNLVTGQGSVFSRLFQTKKLRLEKSARNRASQDMARRSRAAEHKCFFRMEDRGAKNGLPQHLRSQEDVFDKPN